MKSSTSQEEESLESRHQALDPPFVKGKLVRQNQLPQSGLLNAKVPRCFQPMKQNPLLHQKGCAMLFDERDLLIQEVNKSTPVQSSADGVIIQKLNSKNMSEILVGVNHQVPKPLEQSSGDEKNEQVLSDSCSDQNEDEEEEEQKEDSDSDKQQHHGGQLVQKKISIEDPTFNDDLKFIPIAAIGMRQQPARPPPFEIPFNTVNEAPISSTQLLWEDPNNFQSCNSLKDKGEKQSRRPKSSRRAPSEHALKQRIQELKSFELRPNLKIINNEILVWNLMFLSTAVLPISPAYQILKAAFLKHPLIGGCRRYIALKSLGRLRAMSHMLRSRLLKSISGLSKPLEGQKLQFTGLHVLLLTSLSLKTKSGSSFTLTYCSHRRLARSLVLTFCHQRNEKQDVDMKPPRDQSQGAAATNKKSQKISKKHPHAYKKRSSKSAQRSLERNETPDSRKAVAAGPAATTPNKTQARGKKNQSINVPVDVESNSKQSNKDLVKVVRGRPPRCASPQSENKQIASVQIELEKKPVLLQKQMQPDDQSKKPQSPPRPSKPYNEQFLEHNQSRHLYHKEIKQCLKVVNPPRSQPDPVFTKTSPKPITIIFDLDETLVKATSVKDPIEMKNLEAFDFRVPIGEAMLCVSYRPHMVETLKALHQHFELILFTAGHLPYATALALILQHAVFNSDRPKLFDHVLSREQCILMSNRKNPQQLYFQKDLQILTEGRSLSSMVIVDNRAVSFSTLHLANGLPIRDYEGDKTDAELPKLKDYLLSNFLPKFSQSVNTYLKKEKEKEKFGQLRGGDMGLAASNKAAGGSSGCSGKLQSGKQQLQKVDVREVIRRDFGLEPFLERQKKYRERARERERQAARNQLRLLKYSGLNK